MAMMRPTGKRLCALRVAGYVPDAAFLEAQRLLSVAVISSAVYEPPARPAVQAVHQAVRDKSTRFSLGWHGGDKLAFLESAKRLAHPAQEADLGLPSDLLEAIEFVVSKREDIAAWRQRRMALLRDCKAMIAPLRHRMIEDMTPAVRHVCAEYDLAFMALVVNATKHPDVYIVRHFLKGFPTHGLIPSCGVFTDGGEPPEFPADAVLNYESNVRFNAYLHKSVAARGLKAAEDKLGDPWQAIGTVWEATTKECADGWCIGSNPNPVSGGAFLYKSSTDIPGSTVLDPGELSGASEKSAPSMTVQRMASTASLGPWTSFHSSGPTHLHTYALRMRVRR